MDPNLVKCPWCLKAEYSSVSNGPDPCCFLLQVLTNPIRTPIWDSLRRAAGWVGRPPAKIVVFYNLKRCIFNAILPVFYVMFLCFNFPFFIFFQAKFCLPPLTALLCRNEEKNWILIHAPSTNMIYLKMKILY